MEANSMKTPVYDNEAKQQKAYRLKELLSNALLNVRCKKIALPSSGMLGKSNCCVHVNFDEAGTEQHCRIMPVMHN